MHPEEIKAELKKIGVTQIAIAKKCRVTKTTVFSVIHGGCKSTRVASCIATLLKRDCADLWPGRYERKVA